MTSFEIEYLTEEPRLIELCSLYWEFNEAIGFLNKPSKLAARFGFSTRDVSRVVAQNCVVRSTEEKCVRCGISRTFSSQTDYLQRRSWQTRSWVCSDCERAAREEARQEYYREQERQRAADLARMEHLRRVIKESFKLIETDPIDLASLSLESAVYLLSFVRLGANEDFTHIIPAQLFTEPLAPTADYKYEIIRQLDREGLITVHPDSPLEAFIFKDERIHYYLDKVIWALPFGREPQQKKQVIIDLEAIFKNKEWPKNWHQEWMPLWKKIALHECFEYLAIALSEHDFAFKPGDKTRLVFSNLLEDYSVAQAYNLIWQGTKDAASFYVRQQVTRQHAANYAINSIQRRAERGRAEGWDFKPFRRNPKYAPQSVVSAIFFNTVLQIGEAGFNTPVKLGEHQEEI